MDPLWLLILFIIQRHLWQRSQSLYHRRRSPINIGGAEHTSYQSVHSHNMGDREQCREAKRIHVKYLILGGSGGMLPQKNFEKWSNLDGSGSYLEAIAYKCLSSKCDVHIVGLYTSVKYWGGSAPPCEILGGLQPPQPPLPTPMISTSHVPIKKL